MPAASFHLLPGTGADWLAWAATGAPAIKVCDASLIAPARALGAAPLYRPCFLPSDNGEGACADGDAWGRAVLSELARYGTPWPAVVQFRNELPCTADAAAQYARFRAVLRQADFPGLVGFGSFGVGQPDFPQYQYLAGADCVIFDEYLDLTVAGSAPYYALRHVEAIRRGLLSPTQLLYIGEWGSDALGIEDRQKRRGWQDRGKLTAAQQAANLRAYLAGCAPSVQRVFVFCDGPTPPAPAGWSDFATRSTPVEAAIRATWPTPFPAAPTTTKEGHPMPAPLFQFMQDAGSSDCWCECLRSFFLRYGYALDLDLVFQAGKGHARPVGGEAATFAEVKHAVTVLAQQLGVKVQMADFDAPNVVAAALHDPDTANPWTIIAGVAESVLQPGQNYGHFILLDHEDANGMVKVVDSYTNVDGDATEYYPFAQVAQAMIANWESQIDACGFKIVS